MKTCWQARSGIATAASFVAVWSYCLSLTRADDTLNSVISEAFTFAGTQLANLADNVLVDNDVFTDYTDASGKWVTVDSDGDPKDKTVWTSGMVAGMFWYQYEYTGDSVWKTEAEYFTSGMSGAELLDDNDVGFQIFNSYGQGYRLTGEAAYVDTILTGAETLYNLRYEDLIPAFWSWMNPSRRPEWDMAVNVDMMMNMEIMLWAAENGGNDAYVTAVEGHADATWKDIVRDDNSTFHVAAYDPATGDLVDQGTYQGWQDSSTWSRGQAWAIYGYVMVYRFLKKERFLSYSIGLLEYFEANVASDNVPFSDFDAPEDEFNPKDSSSTAIVGSALFELFETTGDPVYLETAQSYLSSVLSADYYQPSATDGWESILRKASSEWDSDEVGAVFGDYFLLEAMVRYKRMAPAILLREEVAEVTVTAAVPGGRKRGRRLQQLPGGKFCAVEIQEGRIVFTDPNCVPVAPELATISSDDEGAGGEDQTPAPSDANAPLGGGSTTPSPQVVVDVPVETPSPMTASSPDGTAQPTVAGAVGTDDDDGMMVATALEFSAADLDNDVDLTGLVSTSEAHVWFGITLTNVDLVPIQLEIECETSFSGEIDAPSGGWKSGKNQVLLTYPAGSLSETSSAGKNEVVKVVVVFELSSTADERATNEVIINHVVLGHSLNL